MNCLAVDLGTKTGYAYGADVPTVGTWTLSTDKEVAKWGKDRLTRRKDPRIARLCEKVGALGPFDVLVFEDVQFRSSTYQTQLWSSLRTALWLCGTAQVFECVPVKSLKLFAGHGNADKNYMSRALKQQHPKLWKPEYDDNTIDAVWLWLWAQKNLSRIVINPIVTHHD